jgi:hypothetical protein
MGKWEWRNKEATERSAKQRRGKPDYGSNSWHKKCEKNAEGEQKSPNVSH